MPPTGPAPARITRETRLLLITALVSLLALWVLARFRFPERTASPNPLPPVLTQFTPRTALDEVPAAVAELGPRLAGLLVAVRSAAGAAPGGAAVPGLRVAADLAVVAGDGPEASGEGLSVVARDGVTGLALVRVPAQSVPAAVPWTPRRVDYPRYFLATDLIDETITFRPVFAGSLQPVTSAAWGDVVWRLPQGTDVAPGAFVFTVEGALAGLTIDHEPGRAIVPAATVLEAAERLAREPGAPRGGLGLQVQPLTRGVARATGAAAGVVVAWVDPEGPAAGRLAPADVIEAVSGTRVAAIEDWRVGIGRLAPGDAVEVAVRRGGEVRLVPLVAGADRPPGGGAPPGDLAHGLTLRAVPGRGAEVLRVQPASAAALAGLAPGDVITMANGVEAPSPAQVVRAFAAAPGDRPLLVAVSRGDAHRVAALAKR